MFAWLAKPRHSREGGAADSNESTRPKTGTQGQTSHFSVGGLFFSHRKRTPRNSPQTENKPLLIPGGPSHPKEPSTRLPQEQQCTSAARTSNKKQKGRTLQRTLATGDPYQSRAANRRWDSRRSTKNQKNAEQCATSTAYPKAPAQSARATRAGTRPGRGPTHMQAQKTGPTDQAAQKREKEEERKKHEEHRREKTRHQEGIRRRGTRQLRHASPGRLERLSQHHFPA